MAGAKEGKQVVRVVRLLQFAGTGLVATVGLPCALKQINGLKKGDSVEIVFDLNDPSECKLIFRKKAGGGYDG